MGIVSEKLGGMEVSDLSALRRPRLSSVLLESDGKSFDSIVTLPSNVQAVESSLLFATGRLPFVTVLGPSGWGKSHLLQAAATACAVVERIPRPTIINAKEFIATSYRIDPSHPLIIDDVQDALEQHKIRIQLRLALERRVRAGRPVLLAFSAPRATRAIKSFLPAYHTAWVTATIEPPNANDRQRVVGAMAKAEGLILAESLVRILARKLPGDGRTFEGALKRLRLAGDRWLDAASVLRALGVLNPYFADHGSWDLREFILEAVYLRCKTEWNRDLALYVMLHIALLPEAEVASFMEIDPGTAFTRANRFRKEFESNEDVRLQTRRCIDSIVDGVGN